MDAHGEPIDASPDLRNAIEALRTAGRHPSRALADAVLPFGAAAVLPVRQREEVQEVLRSLTPRATARRFDRAAFGARSLPPAR